MIFVDLTTGTITQREPRESLRPVANRIMREIVKKGRATYGRYTFTARRGKSGIIMACEIIPSSTPGIPHYAGLSCIYDGIVCGEYES